MKTRDVVFYSEGAKMAGTIYLPDDYKEGEKRAAVLCNSGWTGVNKCYPALYARALTAYGFVCMGFDYRTLPLAEDTVSVLLGQKKKAGSCLWVFPSPNGGPIFPDSVLHMLHRVLKRAGLPRSQVP